MRASAESTCVLSTGFRTTALNAAARHATISSLGAAGNEIHLLTASSGVHLHHFLQQGEFLKTESFGLRCLGVLVFMFQGFCVFGTKEI